MVILQYSVVILSKVIQELTPKDEQLLVTDANLMAEKKVWQRNHFTIKIMAHEYLVSRLKFVHYFSSIKMEKAMLETRSLLP